MQIKYKNALLISHIIQFSLAVLSSIFWHFRVAVVSPQLHCNDSLGCEITKTFKNPMVWVSFSSLRLVGQIILFKVPGIKKIHNSIVFEQR